MKKYVKPNFDVEKINIDDIILVSTSENNHHVDDGNAEPLIVGGIFKPGEFRL